MTGGLQGVPSTDSTAVPTWFGPADRPLFAVVSASCGDTTDTSPSQLNLDRPIDVAFACYGGLRITHGAAGAPTDEIQIVQALSGG